MASRAARIAAVAHEIFGTLPNRNVRTGLQYLKKSLTGAYEKRYYMDPIEPAARLVSALVPYPRWTFLSTSIGGIPTMQGYPPTHTHKQKFRMINHDEKCFNFILFFLVHLTTIQHPKIIFHINNCATHENVVACSFISFGT